MKAVIRRSLGILNAYYRPNQRYECGRACEAGGACLKGPTNSGGCQGVRGCDPLKVDDRWVCQRLSAAGGPCADGPSPTGECCMTRPPCAPKPTLRTVRGRFSLVALLLGVALLSVSLTGSEDQSGSLALDAGPLSPSHVQFTQEEGCASCHDVHLDEITQWIAAVGTESDLSSQCLTCHEFEGEGTAPHSMGVARFTSSAQVGAEALQCAQCHTSHQGELSAQVTGADKTCLSCHSDVSSQFASGHPAFSPTYPHDAIRPSIIFNHQSHLNKHFDDAEYQDKAPANCVGCHDTSRAERTVPVKSFESVCADCHVSQISQRPMTLFNFPILESPVVAAEDLEGVCRPQSESDANYILTDAKQQVVALIELSDAMKSASLRDLAVELFEANGVTEDLSQTLQDVLGETSAQLAKDAPEMLETLERLADDFAYLLEYEPVSDRDLAPLFSQLIAQPIDDADAYQDAVGELLLAIAEDGDLSALADLVEEAGISPVAGLRGLSPVMMRDAACGWLQNQEYLSGFDAEFAGWSVDALGVNYTAAEHADPVLRTWIDFVATSMPPESSEAPEVFDAFLNQDGGAGNCVKCHSVLAVDGQMQVQWNYAPTNEAPLVKYDHEPHLNLLGPGAWCASCHKEQTGDGFADAYLAFDPQSYVSNFSPIGKEQCASCHNDQAISESCSTCHVYHVGHAIQMNVFDQIEHVTRDIEGHQSKGEDTNAATNAY